MGPNLEDQGFASAKTKVRDFVWDELKHVFCFGWNQGFEAGKEEAKDQRVSDMDYRDGLEDGRMEVWDFIAKVVQMTPDERKEIFGKPYQNDDLWLFFKDNKNFNSAYAKFMDSRSVVKKDDSFVILLLGDEVECGGEKGIITHFDDPAKIHVLCLDGMSDSWLKNDCVKTGRHFDIAELFKQMREE